MKQLLLVLVLTAGIISAQNYKKIQLDFTSPEQLGKILTLISESDNFEVNKDGSLISFVSDDDYTALLNAGFKPEVLISDWNEYYKNQPVLTESEKEAEKLKSKSVYGVEDFGYGSMGGFYTFSEIVEKLDEMRTNYPNLITAKYSIGTSIEGRDIWAVKISDNPDIDEDEPEVMYDALIHAREPASMATLLYFMYYLLENYGTDPEVTYLVNNREIYCVPCFNPDGYEYNRVHNPSGGGMWRKNRVNSGSGNYGVDLNRNFGYAWGYDNSGSSPDPSDETYRGASAFSEPETQVIRDFANQHEFKTYINLHTYSNVIIYPWGFINEDTPDSMVYREFAGDMSRFNGYDFGYSGAMLGYNSNGTARDWMYGDTSEKGKVFSYVFEIGTSSDGFWPSESRIYPLAQENLGALIYNTKVAGEFVSVISTETNPEYFNPGANVDLYLSVKNKGLSTAYNVELTAESLSGYLTVDDNPIVTDSIPARSEMTVSQGIGVTVDESAPIGVPQQLIMKTFLNSTLSGIDTLNVIPGIPTLLFDDEGEDISENWNVTSSTSHEWETTESSYTSAPTSYTDSKNGNYASNSNVVMTLNQPVDLTETASASLTFYSKWSIETDWDCGTVQISTNNGSSWTKMEGNYTVPGSGSGQQVSGEPVYEGTMSSWVMEEIDLSDFYGESVLIRFVLESDGYLEQDGWYIDDIKIYYYGEGNVNPDCVDVEVASGWNLLSVPMNAANMATDDLFPGAATQAYGYTNTYVVLSELDNYAGFWLKFNNTNTYQICGDQVEFTVPVAEGWNIIGGTDVTTNISSVVSEPAGIVTSNFFEYNGAYSTASDIVPGKGYWVKTSAAGVLKVSGSAKKTNTVEYLNSITFTDAAGNKGSLKITDNSNINTDMPPVPPAGAFDVRFETGKFGVEQNESAAVNLTGAQYPVIISVTSGNVKLLLNGSEVVINNESPLILNEKPGSLVYSGSVIPSEFAVAQNYPNPFNPSTKISFALPVESKVTITVYNMLGQKVEELVNGMMSAGQQEVELNAGSFASGMYIYNISAKGADGRSFTATKKMMLMK